MKNPIFASKEHETIVEEYLNVCKEFVEDVSPKTKNENYLEVYDLIVDYHNGYGDGVKENNFYDWLMILPINLSVATSGYFAGIENKRNVAKIRAYKVLLQELLIKVVDKLGNIKLQNE